MWNLCPIRVPLQPGDDDALLLLRQFSERPAGNLSQMNDFAIRKVPIERVATPTKEAIPTARVPPAATPPPHRQ
jgi:hypothetical protein